MFFLPPSLFQVHDINLLFLRVISQSLLLYIYWPHLLKISYMYRIFSFDYLIYIYIYIYHCIRYTTFSYIVYITLNWGPPRVKILGQRKLNWTYWNVNKLLCRAVARLLMVGNQKGPTLINICFVFNLYMKINKILFLLIIRVTVLGENFTSYRKF